MARRANRTWLSMLRAEDIIVDIGTVANEETAEPISPLSRSRILAFQIVFFAGFVVLAGVLWNLQFVESSKYKKFATDNTLRVRTIMPNRGIIYDRNKTQLVRNKPSYTISITPYDLPKDKHRETMQRLQRLLNIPDEKLAKISDEVIARRSASAYVPVQVANKVDRELALLIAERRLELPGVVVDNEPVREYLTADLMTHILGYVGRITEDEYKTMRENAESAGYNAADKIGKTGLELSYERDLRGQRGQDLIEVNSNGVPVRTLDGGIPAVPGRSLRLTIDLEIQKKMMEIARRESEQHEVVVIIIMDPQTGQLIALADWPSFDNNFFSGDISEANWKALNEDPLLPLINHALSSHYPPGSSFKVVTAAAGMHNNIIDGNTMITAAPRIYVPNQYYPNRRDLAQVFIDPGVPGPQNVVDALAHSSNSFFYQVAGGSPAGEWEGLGHKRLGAFARLFNMGGLTGIDLPDEVTGIIPDETWKKRSYGDDEVWTRGDTYLMGIGQGFVTATPIQMAVVIAAFANGGTIYQPQLVQEVIDANGRVVRPFQAKPVRKLPNTPEQIRLIQEGMRKNMTWHEGTAYDYNVPEVFIAGKTGTAEYEVDPNDTTRYRKSHGWFISYTARAENLPADYALCVFVQKGGGAKDGARITQEIVRYLYGLPDPQPPKQTAGR